MTPIRHRMTKAEHDYHAAPDNESAARALIEAYQQAGRRNDALQVGLRLLLHLDTLNRLPEPETQRLMQSLAAASPVSNASHLISRRSLFAACAAVTALGVGAWMQKPERPLLSQSEVNLRASTAKEADRIFESAAKQYHDGKYNPAAIKAQVALDKYRSAGLTVGEGKASILIGQIFETWGKFSLAEYWISTGAAQIRDAGQPLEAANALNIAASLNTKLGNFEQARTQNEQSLQIRTTESDENGIIECLRERGTIFAEQGNYLAAEAAWSDAARRARKAKKRDMTASLNYLRGTYAIRQGLSDEGTLDASLRYWQEIDHDIWQARVRMRQAERDIQIGQITAAQAKISFSRRIYTQLDSRIGLADCKVLEGQMAMAQGDKTLAQNKIGEAIAFYEKEGLKPRFSQATRILRTPPL